MAQLNPVELSAGRTVTIEQLFTGLAGNRSQIKHPFPKDLSRHELKDKFIVPELAGKLARVAGIAAPWWLLG